jgi:hypothetical protein
MTSGTKPDGHASDELAVEVTRLAEAYRRMPHSKFTLRLDPYGDRATAGHWLATRFAVLAQGLEEADRPEAPEWRRLPALEPFALGDQLEVTGKDLLRAYGRLEEPGTVDVWTPDEGRMSAEKALAAVLDRTTALLSVL